MGVIFCYAPPIETDNQPGDDEMSTASTAKRRRRQAVIGNAHVAKLGRRRYRHTDAVTASRRLLQTIEREKALRARRSMRKG